MTFGKLLSAGVVAHVSATPLDATCAQPGWNVYDPTHHYAKVPAPCCDGQIAGLNHNGPDYTYVCPLPGCALPGWSVFDQDKHYVFHTPAACCDGQNAVRNPANASDFVCPTGKSPAFPFGCGIGIAGDWPYVGQLFDAKYNYDLTTQVLAAQAVVDKVPNSKQVWRYDWRSSEHPYSPNKWTYMAMDWCNHGGFGEHPDASDVNSVGVMGWNEPNSAQQCGQNPANDTKAVAEYVAVAKAFKAVNKLVVSPATTKDAGTWLDDFLAEYHRQGSFDMDYIAYHHYAECNSDTTSAQMYAELEQELTKHIGLMNKYNGMGFHIKGIWLTEIACMPDGGWDKKPVVWAPGAPKMLMDQFMALVNNHVELKAWAWFPYFGFGPLWDTKPPYTALTELGETYFGNCHQDRAPAEESLSVVV